ncbi:MAG: hypothetical protein KGP27_12785 [Hyphomicrobiales bacterium]|nr:hypothetical protein [Hyphomicrobiales bacterium]
MAARVVNDVADPWHTEHRARAEKRFEADAALIASFENAENEAGIGPFSAIALKHAITASLLTMTATITLPPCQTHSAKLA